MKKQFTLQRIVAMALVLAIAMGVLPLGALAASPVATVYANSEDTLQREINAAPDGIDRIIEITQDIYLTKTIHIPAGKKVTIQSTRGNSFTVQPNVGTTNTFSSALFLVGDWTEGAADTTFANLILNGQNEHRLISSLNNSNLALQNVIIRNGYSSGANDPGAGIYMTGGTLIASNTEFRNNQAVAGVGTMGGAVYLSNTASYFRKCMFEGNTAHSGGAIYFYGGGEKSVLFIRDCEFFSNIADQRGGAVLCHGYAMIANSIFGKAGRGNESGQYGGAIYVSSQDKLVEGAVQGKLTLRDSDVQYNTAGSGGAGIFVSNHSYIYLAGAKTTVKNNNVLESKGEKNNVFYSGTDSRIIVTSQTAEVGISTSNPTKRKLAVFSAVEADDPTDFLNEVIVKRLEEQHWIGPEGFDDQWRDGMSYSMSKDPVAYQNFKYDGEAWRLAIFPDESIQDPTTRLLFDQGSASEISAESPNHKPGNMWLVLDVDDGSTDPHVIYDYNLPGHTMFIVTCPKGTQLTRTGHYWPTDPVHEQRFGNTMFTFLGWYTDPNTGTKVDPDTQTIIINTDTAYYAHWKIEAIDPDDDGDIPPTHGMFLIYFDQNYPGGGFTASYKVAGDFTFTVHYTVPDEDGNPIPKSKTIPVEIRWGWPSDPYRFGYQFMGWSTTATGGSTVNKATWTPSHPTTTLYAQWTTDSYSLKWDANGGTGGSNTTQRHDETVKPPTTPPTKTGYTFTGWYLDKNCTIPLTSGTLVTGAATFYAGWTPLEYTITWDANYTGGTVTAITQYHDEKLNILPKPVREGYAFGGWYTKPGGAGTRAESYGTVREDVTFYAKWTNETLDYTVRLQWDDQSNNDNVRPERIVVSLMANDIPTGLSYTLDASDADASGNLWSYTFEGLDVTDAVSNPITYSVAITSTVSDQYSYGIENKSATLGYILMTHSLITTDINSYVVWEDDSNNDGYRPSTVNLQLYANGQKVEDAEGRLSISGSGNTWTYSFKGFQKFFTDDAGNKGREIRYTLEAKPTNPGELDKYSIAYHNYTVILSHRKDTVSRTVHVGWQDSNNQDGKRPASMMIQLYADNVPLEGKVVMLSGANNWTHTWDELPKYVGGGREVAYSARVTSTLVDYTAKSTGMDIEMTYVPSSTTISAFVTWTDEHDADGLRPDFITAQLVADGKPTGDSQVLSATSGWTVSWSNYPIYKDGDRIEYTFEVDVPEGYEADYHGVYDTSGLSAVLTHKRIKQELTGDIVWEDRDNQSGARPGKVAVLLYADGSVIDEDDKVWISAEDGWEHTFSNLPVYRDHGQEIKYTMVLVSDPGKYIPTTSKMTITMRLEPEYVDVPFQIIWDDNNDSDGARPGYVAVALLVDGKPSPYGETATVQTDWAVTFTHLDRYGTNGLYLYKAQLAEVPDGYTATYTSPGVVVLKRVAQTKDVTATVTWLDNNNQYRERPEQVTLTLYADRLDGNGPQNTGRVEKCKAADGWTFTFEDVPAYYSGKNILYSVVASGNLPNYTIFYDGMEVFMRHVSYQPPVTVDYTAKVVWHDGHNAKGSRPYNLLVTLYADGESCRSYTMTEADLDATGYTWLHTFTNLPTKVDGKEVAYTIGVTKPAHYIAQTQGNTITMTHVMDIPILVRWHDQNDNDGVRPEVLTLELFGDSVKTDTSIPLTGDHTAEAWRNSFRQIPVWSEAQMNLEIAYTWAFAGDDLDNSSYRVDYNGFTSSTVGNEDLYPIDISRPCELMDIPVLLKWDDDTDRDGLRLDGDGVVVTLLANGEATDKTLTLTGSNEAEIWTGTLKGLPVWEDGQRIVYSIGVADKRGYTPSFKTDNPFNVTMMHMPAKAKVEAHVEWDQTVKDKFDIAAELVVDGESTGSIGVLDAEHVYKENWGERYVYRDHGQPIDYTVRVAEQTQIPEGHVVEAQGLTVTVKRVLFQLTGHIYNNAKKPVPTALVTLINAIPDQPPRYAITDKDGYYSFTVSHGSFSVYATVSGTSGGHADALINKLQNDTTQDLTLSGFVNLCNCTVKVIDSNGVPASGAEVEVARIGQGIIARLTMDHEGTYTTVLPSSSYDFQASHTTNQGICYRSDVVKRDIWGNTTITITVPVVDTDAKEISGTVLDADGKPVSGIVVQCYHRGDSSFLGVEAKTDANGNFILGGLSDGTYEVVLKDLNGQEINLPSKIIFSIPADTSLNIVLPSGGQDPTPFGQGTLTGVVTDKDGQPVSNAQVVVTDRATSGTASILTTNPDGTFEVSLPTGGYTVEVWKPFDNNTNHPIRVDDDAASSEGGSVTADSFTISGYALDEGGQPMEGVTVYLYGEDGQLLATASLLETEETASEDAAADLFAEDGFIRLDERVTAEDGKYVFKGLPAGHYVVKIAHGGIGGNGGSTDIPVTVQPQSEIPDGADLTVTTDSYTVSGVVMGKAGVPVGNASVTLLDEQGEEVARMATGADGAYTFANLSEGDYTVNISYPDSELLASGDVTISDGSFTAFPGQALSGTLKDSKGNALANVTVTIRGKNGKTYAATTDKDGNYHVIVPDGQYTIEVNINGKTASKTITVNGKAVTADLTITLSDGGSTTPGGNTPGGAGSGGSGGGGGFIPDPGPTEDQTFVLSGTVTDKDGKAVEGANVTATDAKTGKTYTDTTGADGKYALAVPKGNYTITITYGSVSSNPKKVSVSKDSSLDAISMDGLGKLVYGYVTGYGDGTFGGGRPITRSEVAALISRVSSNFDKDKTYAFAFKDVAAKAWYANNLGYCVEVGLIQGRGNGMFDPNANITRAEFAAIVARFLGLPNEVTGESRYTDISGNWAEGYIAQLTAKGIVEGKGAGKFDPSANISRYEAVTMLNRALGRTPDKAALDALAANRTIRPFPDLQVEHWAYYQVLEAAFNHYHK